MKKLSFFLTFSILLLCCNNSSEKKSTTLEPGRSTIFGLVKNPDSTSTPYLIETYLYVNNDSTLKSGRVIKDTAYVIYINVPRYDSVTKKQAVDSAGIPISDPFQKKLDRDSVLIWGIEGKDLGRLSAKGGW